jgi:ATP-dependent DNA ligase
MTKAHQIPPAQCDGSFTAAAALRWPVSADYLCQEKIDGVRSLLQIQPNRAPTNYLTGRRLGRDTGEFVELQDQHPEWRDHAFPAELANCVIDGEIDDHVFWYFDVLLINGRNVIEKPLRERLERLEKLAVHFPAWMQPVRSSDQPAQFLKKVLGSGGEGIVRKKLDETYGFAWSKVKLKESHDVVILAVDAGQRSMRVGQWKGRELVDLGTVTGLSDLDAATAAAHTGEVAEIICHSRDARGRFYKPSLFRWRADKAPSDCVFHFNPEAAGAERAPSSGLSLNPQVRAAGSAT